VVVDIVLEERERAGIGQRGGDEARPWPSTLYLNVGADADRLRKNIAARDARLPGRAGLAVRYGRGDVLEVAGRERIGGERIGGGGVGTQLVAHQVVEAAGNEQPGGDPLVERQLNRVVVVGTAADIVRNVRELVAHDAAQRRRDVEHVEDLRAGNAAVEAAQG